MQQEIYGWSLVELSNKIRAKDVSITEVVDAMLKRIEDHRQTNAFAHVDADQAREAAVSAQQVLSEGGTLPSLLGIPYSAKDVTNCMGVPTRYGSRALPPFVP